MYRGCESAIGLLINLKVIEDKNKDEDQKLAYVENSEFWLRKKPFSLSWGAVRGTIHPSRVGRVVGPIVVVVWPGRGIAGCVVLWPRVVLAVVELLRCVVLGCTATVLWPSVVVLWRWGRSTRCWTAWNTSTTTSPEMWLRYKKTRERLIKWWKY